MSKRRANGEGNLRKRKDGRWEGRYTAGRDPETGKAIYKNVLGKTQAEAKAKLKQAIEEAKGLDAAKVGRYTVCQWMEIWFEHYAKVKVRPSSHQTYRGYIDNHIKPSIGKIPLEKLTSLELQKFYKKLLEKGRVDRLESKHQSKGLSAKTVRNIHQISVLCLKTGPGAANPPRQSGRELRPAKGRTQRNENPSSGTASIISAGSRGKWRL